MPLLYNVIQAAQLNASVRKNKPDESRNKDDNQGAYVPQSKAN